MIHPGCHGGAQPHRRRGNWAEQSTRASKFEQNYYTLLFFLTLNLIRLHFFNCQIIYVVMQIIAIV